MKKIDKSNTKYEKLMNIFNSLYKSDKEKIFRIFCENITTKLEKLDFEIDCLSGEYNYYSELKQNLEMFRGELYGNNEH